MFVHDRAEHKRQQERQQQQHRATTCAARKAAAIAGRLPIVKHCQTIEIRLSGEKETGTSPNRFKVCPTCSSVFPIKGETADDAPVPAERVTLPGSESGDFSQIRQRT